MPTNDSVENKHPQWLEHQPDWTIVRDCVEGERNIKSKGQTYLPATSAMIKSGLDTNQPGLKMYNAYKMRAVFPSLVRPAVNALVGVMHREPATIELPPEMESLRENATLQGESLQTLLRRINEAQLLTGRIGLLADVPTTTEDTVPFINTYEAENIINWDESRREDGRLKPDLVVLDETDFERTSTFGWERIRKFLVLDLVDRADIGEASSSNTPETPPEGAVYRSRLEISDDETVANEGVNRQTEVTTSDQSNVQGVTPNIRGETLNEIPFIFVGSIDLTAEPDQVPMLDLANLALTIYRGEADYRLTLFMQGQDTLIIIDPNNDPSKPTERVVGASASIVLGTGGEAYYVGVSSDGLKEQKEALLNDRSHASELGANLLASAGGTAQEAQETLRIRVAARTASITTVVRAGAEGLQSILRIIASWKNADPEAVIVKPNMDFIGDIFEPKQLLDLMAAKNMGAPLSRESIHKWLQDKDVTAMTLEEELALIEEEEPIKGEPDPEADRIAEQARLEAEAERLRLAQGSNQPGGNQDPNATGAIQPTGEEDG